MLAVGSWLLAVGVLLNSSQLSFEQKLGQLTQLVEDRPEFRSALEHGRVGSVLNSGGAEKTNKLQSAALAHSEVPLLFGYDVIHGYRTIFPIPLAIASSWDPSLAELSAHTGAVEARAEGIRWTFAPMVDIARDARWGRIAEGAGEDPVLGAAMAAAYVRGFQGAGVLACAKHYAAYGAAEAGRDYNGAEMSERTLREIYLPPFKAAVDAGVASLMSAFESVNAVPATANQHLLDDILRREWKFKGFVVSDWEGVIELMNHGVAATPREAAIKAITAGVDMDMVDDSYATLPQSMMAVIDRAVQRVLRAKKAAGLFDDPFTPVGSPPPTDRAAAHVPAIAQAWFLGTESGHALADVLFGDVNPSAKLPVTIPRATGQVPIYYNHLPTGRPPNPDDKYTSKYLDVAIGPLYPFGFGLSHTTFEY